jgi:hypothetical protein
MVSGGETRAVRVSMHVHARPGKKNVSMHIHAVGFGATGASGAPRRPPGGFPAASGVRGGVLEGFRGCVTVESVIQSTSSQVGQSVPIS